MLYRSYQEKLEKRRRIFEGVWRFRFPILAGTLLLIALTATLLGIKGLVLEATVPEEVVYGEELPVEAQAIFGDTLFEYRPAAGGAWTEEKPVLAGEYECRAVAFSVAGTRRTGEIHAFRILPAQREVLVRDEKLTYGDEPSFTAQLCYRDTLHVGNFFAHLDGEEVLVSADKNSIRAMSAEGQDVTACYEFVPVQKSVADVFRPLAIRTPDASFEYDGLPHGITVADVVFEGLAAGHTVQIDALPTLTEAGSCMNTIPYSAFHIFDENGEEVTRRYAFSVADRDSENPTVGTPGTLTVERRRITVATPSEAFEYDGTEHLYTTYEITAGSLAAGQTLALTEPLAAEHAGHYANAPTLTVWEGERDVTHNYSVLEDFGSVDISPRAITVTVEAQDVPYDGQPHTFPSPSITAGELAGGQSARYSEPGSAVEAGRYPNEPAVSVYAEETDVTSDYTITKRFGDFVISPLSITVRTAGEIRSYDGQPHPYADLELVGELAPGQRITRTNSLEAENAGTYSNTAEYIIEADEREISKENYTITEEFGEIVIEKLSVTLQTKGETRNYDGKTHTYADLELVGELAPGQTLTRTNSLEAENAGTYPNTAEYIIEADEREISKDNYTIAEEFGEIVIEKLTVTLRTEGEMRDYDGKPHTYADLELVGELAPGQHITRTNSLTAENAGTYPNKAEYIIEDDARQISQDNYTIAEAFGEIVIEKLTVTLHTVSETYKYDGKTHTYKDLQVIGTLAEGQRFERSDVLTAEDAGTYHNTPRYTVTDGARQISEENYIITKEFGEIVIEKLPVTLRTKRETYKYDGTPHTYTELEPEGELAPGQRFERSDVLIAEDAGTYPNVPSYTVRDDTREISEENYTITVDFGEIVIEKLTLTVTTESRTQPYDGAGHFFTNCERAGELAPGQEVSASGFKEFKDAAEYSNTADIVILNGAGRAVTHNYNLTPVYGTVVIEKLVISVTTRSETRAYDGVEHTYSATADDVTKGALAAGQELRYAEPLRVKDAKEYSNMPGGVEIYAGSEKVTHNYIIEETSYGTVVITPLAITVTTVSEIRDYDGKVTGYDDISLGAGELAPGQQLNRTNRVEVKDAGTYPNTAEFTISDAAGVVLKSNYVITEAFGQIEVKKLVISVTTRTDEIYYDGTEHTYSATADDVTKGALAEEQELRYTEPLRVKDAKEYSNAPGGVEVYAGSEKVTHNYIIEEISYGTVTVLCRTVRVQTGTEEFVYNGRPQGNDDVFVSEGAGKGYGLAPFQTFKAISTTRRTDVGDEQNKIEFIIVDAKGEDVTTNYTVEETSYGTVTITARPITLRTGGKSWEYDAEAHTFGDVTLTGGTSLAPDQEITYTFGPLATITDVGTRPNQFSITAKITDGSGADVTHNYAINEEVVYGVLEVTPRKVTLQANSQEVTYDGAFHSPEGYTEFAGTLVKGHTVQTSYVSEKNVGTYPNAPEEWKVFDASSNDVTGNYEIEWREGTLHIYARSVRYVTDSLTVVYDGARHSAENFGYPEGSSASNRLVEGHVCKAEFSSWIDAGRYPNGPRGWHIFEGEEDVTDNYSIVWENGTVEIKPRPVSLLTGSGEWTYDAAPHSAPDFTYNEADYAVGSSFMRFVEGDTVVINDGSYGSITDVGEEENEPASYALLHNGSTPVNIENYELKWTYGTLTVTPRPITVRTQDVAWIYDGNSHAHERELIVTYYLGDSLGHTVAGLFTPRYNAGEYNNECTQIYVYDAFDNNVTKNYEIETEFTGTVSISKRPVKFTSQSATWVMEEGREYAADGYIKEPISAERGLLNNHYPTFTATRLTAITDTADAPGYVDNVWTDIRIYDEYGVDCTNNYAIETEWGKVRVKSPVVVRLYTISKPYDGTPLTFITGDWYIQTLPPDVTAEQVTVELVGELTEPGALTLEEVWEQSKDRCSVSAEGPNRIDFVGSPEPLKVTKRVLGIRTATIVGVPDGETPLYGTDTEGESFWLSYNSLVKGHRFADSVTATGVLLPEERTAQNTLSNVVILDENGNNVTQYYEIVVEYGILSWAS